VKIELVILYTKNYW